MAELIDDYVIGLQVSEDNVLLVQGFDTQKDFLNVELGLVFSESAFNLEVLAEITAWAVV